MSAAAYTWSWSDYEAATGDVRPPAPRIIHGGQRRPHGSSLSRFIGTSHHADREAASLAPDHPAIVESRTLFPSSVVSPTETPRLLVSGHNSAKIGANVRKGAWSGLPLFTLTLEERATCPTSCGLLRECFGNAMPFARRHSHGPDLIPRLDTELRTKARMNPRGFVVRVHVLGDFYSSAYALQWLTWMRRFKRLRVFGYTAHPVDSETGAIVDLCNALFPDRWAFRFSVEPDAPIGPMQATTIWRQPEGSTVPEGLVCPAQTERTQACATCGLCWSPAMADTRIAFVGHGMMRRRGVAR